MTKPRPEPARAAIYCRLSLARFGDSTKVEDQQRICRELADRLKWKIATGCGHPGQDGVYTDNSQSAWQKGRKRPGWDKMLTDVEAGTVDGIVVYHGDRLVRRPQDLGRLIDLADSKGIRLASPTGTRNLDSGDDRFILWIEVAAAERSSYDTSRRKIDGYERMRRRGQVRPGGRGGRAFGYEPGDSGVREDEAAVIREACARVLSGESCGSIARDLNGRGVRTSAGGQITHATLTRTLVRPRYAGLMPDGTSPAAWPAILPRADWEMLCAVVAAKAAGFGYATNTRRYLLSGIAECGVCAAAVRVRDQKGYECTADGCRKVYRSVAHLDAYVTGYVTGRLARGQPVQIETGTAASAELAALTIRRAEVEAVLAELASHPGQRADVLARALDSFDVKIDAIREQLAAGSRGHLLTAHAGISREEFAGLPLDVRRALVQATCRVVVMPGRRGPGFDPRYVILSPVTGLP